MGVLGTLVGWKCHVQEGPDKLEADKGVESDRLARRMDVTMTRSVGQERPGSDVTLLEQGALLSSKAMRRKRDSFPGPIPIALAALARVSTTRGPLHDFPAKLA